MDYINTPMLLIFSFIQIGFQTKSRLTRKDTMPGDLAGYDPHCHDDQMSVLQSLNLRQP